MALIDLYPGLKALHVTTVVLSGGFFLVRGLWMMSGSPWLQRRVMRVMPHVVDSFLLVSAVLLMIATQQYPLAQPWLTAKILALLVYIGLGMVAIRHGRTRRARSIALVLALVAFAYIVLVALTHKTLPL